MKAIRTRARTATWLGGRPQGMLPIEPNLEARARLAVSLVPEAAA